ncbi:MAG: glycosyltransferase [Burkholderiaceae bacterium]
MNSLIVFSHLRWNFVYQRPQHLLTRMALRCPVVYIEEPVTGAATDELEIIDAAPGVEVWRPHVRRTEPGMAAVHTPVLQRLVKAAIRQKRILSYWLWFYTPMAVPVASGLDPDGIVYDCMDELSLFRGAPPDLLVHEATLLRNADVVFTGGRSLYNAKRAQRPSVHCFPSSVDALHFRPGVTEHAQQARLPRPRLGYCGVIDERIDLGLVAGIASARPEWSIVMVGPTAKIDPASLPRAPNLHWLGQQRYEDLPAFIAGWDICLLPFALNDATRFISPTKTLEYMACAKPAVSTAIKDVVEPYGHVVPIRADVAGFVEACENFLGRNAAARAAHERMLAEIVAGTSWDATAASMYDLIVKSAPATVTSPRRLAVPEASRAVTASAAAN